jgi:hypothetical protein
VAAAGGAWHGPAGLLGIVVSPAGGAAQDQQREIIRDFLAGCHLVHDGGAERVRLRGRHAPQHPRDALVQRLAAALDQAIGEQAEH